MFESETGSGITRRQALKRGAAVAGTAVWVAPVVQALAMSPASAQQPSGGGGSRIGGGGGQGRGTGQLRGVGHGTRLRPGPAPHSSAAKKKN